MFNVHTPVCRLSPALYLSLSVPLFRLMTSRNKQKEESGNSTLWVCVGVRERMCWLWIREVKRVLLSGPPQTSPKRGDWLHTHWTGSVGRRGQSLCGLPAAASVCRPPPPAHQTGEKMVIRGPETTGWRWTDGWQEIKSVGSRWKRNRFKAPKTKKRF